MKVTIYTTAECPFSKQEKEYLQGHNIAFEERNVETNREYLTEMLAVSNNFAGTPVTKIEKDDGAISVLKGFTQAEFDTALGIVQTAAPQSADGAVTSAPTTPQPDSTTIPAPLDVPAAPSEPISPPAEPAAPTESVAAESTIDTGSPTTPADPISTQAADDSNLSSAPAADDQQISDSSSTPPAPAQVDATLPPAPVVETPTPFESTPVGEAAQPTNEQKPEDALASEATNMNTQPPADEATPTAGNPQDSLNAILENLENKSTAQSLADPAGAEPVAPSAPSDTQTQVVSPTEPPAIPDPKF